MLTFLKSFFSSAARARRTGRHFRRSPMLERGGDVAAVPPDAARHANRRMLELSGRDTETLFQRFGSRAGGLSEAQASAARERHGRNEVDHEAPLRWYVHLWYSYRNPSTCC